MRPDLSFVAMSVDEGEEPSRDMRRIERFAEAMGIEWAGTSFAREFGRSAGAESGHLPTSCRDILRDIALTSLAERMEATRIALGTTLDDRAISVLLSVLRGEPEHHLGGPRPGEGGIPRIRPFLRIPAEEVALYARLNFPGIGEVSCLDAGEDLLKGEVRRILDEYTNRHPATPFSLVNLSEALGEQSVPGPCEPRPCDGCRERFVPTCPVRRILDEVTGYV